MVKSSFFQFELEPRVFGLWKWSIREKTACFLNFQNLKIVVDFDYFWPSLSMKRKVRIRDFLQICKSILYVSYSKLGQKWPKSSKIYKFWKLRKCPVFLRIDHFRSPRTHSSSSNWTKVIFFLAYMFSDRLMRKTLMNCL